ncbi:hypothetical protein LILAB_34245 [Corallococcus macrosporus]|uniref:DUF3137 domain-containing protein n=2 Tax=Myxococcaceae TaxID=31 RepID=F8CGJ5_MYXFH|nr:hypothetical protein LILAB_34245 [Corallococcus macrosporus]
MYPAIMMSEPDTEQAPVNARHLSGRDAPLPDERGDAFEIFVGYFPVLFGLAQFLPVLDGEPLGLKAYLLGPVLIASGSYVIAWGRARRKRFRRVRDAIEASIPSEDRIHQEVLPALLHPLSGTVAPAEPLGFVDSLRQSGQESAPERFERVHFSRGGISLVTYRTHWSKSSRVPVDERGPGLDYLDYWRVRAEVATSVSFQLLPRKKALTLSLTSPGQDETPSFEQAFEVRDPSGWVQAHLGESVREVLTRRTGFYVRCQHGRVECLWPRYVGPDTFSRFEDAAHVVATLARALAAPEVARPASAPR